MQRKLYKKNYRTIDQTEAYYIINSTLEKIKYLAA